MQQQSATPQQIQEQRDYLRQTIGRGFDRPKEISDGVKSGYLSSYYTALDVNTGKPLLTEALGKQVVSATSLSRAGVPTVRAPQIDGSDSLHFRPRSKLFNGELLLRNKRENRGPFLLPQMDDGPMKKMRLLEPADPAGKKNFDPSLPKTDTWEDRQGKDEVTTDRENVISILSSIAGSLSKPQENTSSTSSQPPTNGNRPPPPPPTGSRDYVSKDIPGSKYSLQGGIPLPGMSSNDYMDGDSDTSYMMGVPTNTAGAVAYGMGHLATTEIEQTNPFSNETMKVGVPLAYGIPDDTTTMDIEVPTAGSMRVSENPEYAHAKVSTDPQIVASQKIPRTPKAPGGIILPVEASPITCQQTTGSYYSDIAEEEEMKSNALATKALQDSKALIGAVEETYGEKERLFESETERDMFYSKLNEICSNFDIELADVGDTNAHLKAAIEKMMLVGERMNGKTFNLEDENRRLRLNIDELKKSVSRHKTFAKSAKDELSSKISILESQLNDQYNNFEGEKLKLGSQIEQYHKTIVNLDSQLDSLRNEASLRQTSSTEDKTELNSLKKELVTMEAEKLMALKAQEELAQQAALNQMKWQKNSESLNERIIELKQSLRSQSSDLANYKEQFELMYARYKETSKLMQSVSADNKRLNEAVSTGEMDREKLRIEYEKEISERKKVTEKATREKAKKEAQIVSLRDELKSTRNNYDQLKGQYRELNEILSSTAKTDEERIVILTGELNTMGSQIEFRDKEISEMHIRIRNLEQEKNKIQGILEANHAKTLHLLNQKDEKIDMLKNVYQEYEEVAKLLKTRFGNYSNLRELNEKIENVYSEGFSLGQKITAGEWDKTLRETQEAFKKEMKAKDGLIMSMDENIKTARAGLIEKDAQLLQANDILTSKNADIELANQKIGELGTELARGEALYGEAKQVNMSQAGTITNLTSQLDELKAGYDYMESMYNTLQEDRKADSQKVDRMRNRLVDGLKLCQQVLIAVTHLSPQFARYKISEEAKGFLADMFKNLNSSSANLAFNVMQDAQIVSDIIALDHANSHAFFEQLGNLLQENQAISDYGVDREIVVLGDMYEIKKEYALSFFETASETLIAGALAFEGSNILADASMVRALESATESDSRAIALTQSIRDTIQISLKSYSEHILKNYTSSPFTDEKMLKTSANFGTIVALDSLKATLGHSIKPEDGSDEIDADDDLNIALRESKLLEVEDVPEDVVRSARQALVDNILEVFRHGVTFYDGKTRYNREVVPQITQYSEQYGKSKKFITDYQSHKDLDSDEMPVTDFAWQRAKVYQSARERFSKFSKRTVYG